MKIQRHFESYFIENPLTNPQENLNSEGEINFEIFSDYLSKAIHIPPPVELEPQTAHEKIMRIGKPIHDICNEQLDNPKDEVSAAVTAAAVFCAADWVYQRNNHSECRTARDKAANTFLTLYAQVPISKLMAHPAYTAVAKYYPIAQNYLSSKQDGSGRTTNVSRMGMSPRTTITPAGKTSQTSEKQPASTAKISTAPLSYIDLRAGLEKVTSPLTPLQVKNLTNQFSPKFRTLLNQLNKKLKQSIDNGELTSKDIYLIFAHAIFLKRPEVAQPLLEHCLDEIKNLSDKDKLRLTNSLLSCALCGRKDNTGGKLSREFCEAVFTEYQSIFRAILNRLKNLSNPTAQNDEARRILSFALKNARAGSMAAAVTPSRKRKHRPQQNNTHSDSATDNTEFNTTIASEKQNSRRRKSRAPVRSLSYPRWNVAPDKTPANPGEMKIIASRKRPRFNLPNNTLNASPAALIATPTRIAALATIPVQTRTLTKRTRKIINAELSQLSLFNPSTLSPRSAQLRGTDQDVQENEMVVEKFSNAQPHTGEIIATFDLLNGLAPRSLYAHYDPLTDNNTSQKDDSESDATNDSNHTPTSNREERVILFLENLRNTVWQEQRNYLHNPQNETITHTESSSSQNATTTPHSSNNGASPNTITPS